MHKVASYPLENGELAWSAIPAHTSFFRKGYLLEVDQRIHLVTLNLFERILVPLLRLVNIDYLSRCFDGKQVTVLTQPQASTAPIDPKSEKIVGAKELLDILDANLPPPPKDRYKKPELPSIRKFFPGESDEQIVARFQAWGKDFDRLASPFFGYENLKQISAGGYAQFSELPQTIGVPCLLNYMRLSGQIGHYSTTRSGQLIVELRSECATPNDSYKADYQKTFGSLDGAVLPVTREALFSLYRVEFSLDNITNQEKLLNKAQEKGLFVSSSKSHAIASSPAPHVSSKEIIDILRAKFTPQCSLNKPNDVFREGFGNKSDDEIIEQFEKWSSKLIKQCRTLGGTRTLSDRLVEQFPIFVTNATVIAYMILIGKAGVTFKTRTDYHIFDEDHITPSIQPRIDNLKKSGNYPWIISREDLLKNAREKGVILSQNWDIGSSSDAYPEDFSATQVIDILALLTTAPVITSRYQAKSSPQSEFRKKFDPQPDEALINQFESWSVLILEHINAKIHSDGLSYVGKDNVDIKGLDRGKLYVDIILKYMLLTRKIGGFALNRNNYVIERDPKKTLDQARCSGDIRCYFGSRDQLLQDASAKGLKA